MAATAGGSTPTGCVIFTIDTVAGSNVALTAGSATQALSSTLSVGPHTVLVTYNPPGTGGCSGSSTGYATSSAGSNVTTAITVNQAATTSTISLTGGGGTGSPTFTVTVAGNSPATTNPTTGTVTLYYDPTGNPGGSTNIGTGSLSGTNQVAITSTSTLSAAGNPYNIWASYAGNASFAGSNSTGSSYSVTAPVGATLSTPTASPNPVTFGQAVTFTGTVSANSGSLAPTGAGGVDGGLTFCIYNSGNTQVNCSAVLAVTGNSPPGTSQAQYAIPASLTPILTGGSYTVKTSYTNTDGVYTNSGPSVAGSFTVSQAAASFTVTSSATVNQQVAGTNTVTMTATYSGNLSPKPTGTITFVNSSASSAFICSATLGAVTAGVASCTAAAGPGGAAGLQVGPVTAVIQYSSDVNFTLGTVTPNPYTFSIVKASTATTVTASSSDTPSPTFVGRTVTVTATTTANGVTIQPTQGNIAITPPGTNITSSTCATPTLGATTANSATVSCTFVVTAPVPAMGASIAAAATYTADANTLGSSQQASLQLQQVATSTVLTSTSDNSPNPGSPLPTEIGRTVTLTAVTTVITPGVVVQPKFSSIVITPPAGNSASSTCVTPKHAAVSDTSTSVTVKCTFVLTGPFPNNNPASVAANASYTADTATGTGASTATPGTILVTKATTITTITPIATTAAGQPNVRVSVTYAATASGVPTGTVQLLVGSGVVATGALSTSTTACPTGVAVCGVVLFTAPADTYSASYSGDANSNGSASGSTAVAAFTPASSTVSLNASPNPAQTGQAIVLTAAVSGLNGPGQPSGSVTFSDNLTVIGVGLVVGGVATITTTLGPGSHTVGANYSGDSIYPGASTSIGVTVAKPAATVTFSSNLMASVFGQSVTLMVRFSGSQGVSALPTGAVQFLDNGLPIGNPVTIVNGMATLTLGSLPPGTNNIGVSYNGDGNFSSLTRNAGTVTAAQAQVTTTLASTTSGSQMTLTVMVAVVAPGSGTPTGTVKFVDSVTEAVLGTATVSGGVASIAIPVTNHPVMAFYSGDSNFLTGTSSSLAAIALSDAASYAAVFSPDEIVTVFGHGMTTDTLAASLPLPTSLGGITVTVTDSAGMPRQAVLFYVSPAQLSFLIPAGTATGTATVTVNSAAGSLTATITVSSSTAALFTANANGQGPLAAQVVAVTPDGQQTYTNTAILNGTSFVNAPISFSPTANTFYLLLYGTGFDSASTVTVTINGKSYTPTYSGPQGTFAGLDQINLLLPASLAGSGQVNVSITKDGQTSNAGTIAFQ